MSDVKGKVTLTFYLLVVFALLGFASTFNLFVPLAILLGGGIPLLVRYRFRYITSRRILVLIYGSFIVDLFLIMIVFLGLVISIFTNQTSVPEIYPLLYFLIFWLVGWFLAIVIRK